MQRTRKNSIDAIAAVAALDGILAMAALDHLRARDSELTKAIIKQVALDKNGCYI